MKGRIGMTQSLPLSNRRKKLRSMAAQLLYFLLCGLLCACDQAPPNPAPVAQSGTRIDPYVLGQELTLHTKSGSNVHTVDYHFCFTALWDNAKIKLEYPNYLVRNRLLLRGTMSVDCESAASELLLNLTPVFVAVGGEMVQGHFELYKPAELNNALVRVRAGEEYDIIVLKSDQGSTNFVPAFLMLEYTNTDGVKDSIWIDLQEDQEDEEIIGDEEE